MPSMIITIDGIVIKEITLNRVRTTLGRRPYNDIVIDNLAVSGEHAVLQTDGKDVYIEDLNSTNGTYLNGKAVKKQRLQNRDVLEIGKHKIEYLSESGSSSFETLSPSSQFAQTTSLVTTAVAEPTPQSLVKINAVIQVLTGAAAGRELALVKPVTTIGKPGVAVATVSRSAQGFVLTHLEGLERPRLNGIVLGEEAALLRSGDLVLLAGTEMLFLQN